MLKKFASVLIAASMLTAPAFAQGTATPAAKAPVTAPAPAAKAAVTTAPAASTVTTKVIKKNKKAKHVKHVRHIKHVTHVKKVRHHGASKTVVAKPMTAPAAALSRTN